MGDAPSRYINRELSWLEFNSRVLDEARAESIPLLERLKFLAITASNLDEFFMVRVGGLQLLSRQGNTKPDPAGMTPDEQLSAISVRTHRMTADQYACYLSELEPGLSAAGIRRVRTAELSERQKKFLEQAFNEEISAVLTPMAVSTAAAFPLLQNQTLNICVRLAPAPDGDGPRFAIIPFGRSTSRIITLPSDGGYSYILLEDVVSMYGTNFFPGEAVQELVPFRITRNADLSIREDLASDLLEEMEEILDARKEGNCVRLEIADHASKELQHFLESALHVRSDEVYSSPGPLDLASFMRLTDLQGFDNLK
ncbi:MAG: RNA degradosome polyphosphate kinase, partial [Planctomycetaceae bacterium]